MLRVNSVVVIACDDLKFTLQVLVL
jgi:hypothetical protein